MAQLYVQRRNEVSDVTKTPLTQSGRMKDGTRAQINIMTLLFHSFK